ncbi:MAG: hydantoinase/oxoprolinase family protein [Gemmobacter sp.]
MIGAGFLGDLIGVPDVIAADMGGTTFKVGVIRGGQIGHAREPRVDRFHSIAPKIEVVSIGSGGGSIVAVDPATRLPSVGPRSAGARPGPVCPGRGGPEATLRDAMLRIGSMNVAQLLGGSMALDRAGAEAAFAAQMADPPDMDVMDAAIAIVRIARA